MRTFAQKQSQSKRVPNVGLARSSASAHSLTHGVNTVLCLQHGAEKQGAQRVPGISNEGAEPNTALIMGFGHDFSKIPVRSKAPAGLQAKLAIGTPEDVYEQEAERIAENVTSIPDSRLQPACACGGECPTCRMGQSGQAEALVLTNRAQTNGEPTPEAPPVVYDELRSPGQPIDPATLSYFEPRFGFDFSHVRVHTGSKASESARAINALAYTVGRDIVFSSGQYQPGTASGRRLLAHELTHVIQQSPDIVRQQSVPAESSAHTPYVTGRPLAGAVIQRAHDCDTERVEAECADADSTCLSVQDSYCALEYPGTKEIEQLYVAAVAGAESEKAAIPHAAQNLLHFLSGAGTEKVMPSDIFKNHPATKDKLAGKHRAQFIAGAIRRLGDGELKPGGSAEMVWTDSAQAFDYSKDDLGLAVGGYTLCSKVQVSAQDKGSGNVEITFDAWTVQVFDCYNWEPGKGIGGLFSHAAFGEVSDEDLCCLQNAGKGKHFQIRTDPWENDHAPSLANETVSAASSPPESAGSQESEDSARR